MSKNNFTNNAAPMQNYRTTRYTHVYDKELNRWRLGLLEVPEDTNIRPAVSNPIADLSVYEDSPFYFQFPENVFTDDNPDDVLTYTATQLNGQLLPAWLTFNSTTREFSGTPSNDDVAVLSIKVVATDSNRANIADVFDLTVINTNDSPMLSDPILDQTMPEDSTISFTIPLTTFVELDQGDVLTFTVTLSDGSPLPAWLTFDSPTRNFSASPTNDNVGIHGISLTATDLFGASATNTFTLVVTNVNDTPTVTQIPNNTGYEDTYHEINISSYFIDVDYNIPNSTEQLSFSAEGLPPGYTIDSTTGIISGNSTNDTVGDYSVSVTGTDLENESVTSTFTLSIENVNDAPIVVGSLTNQALTDADSLSYQFPSNTFSDEDLIHGDVITYSASGLPSGVTLDSNNRTFSGTPAQAGSYIVTVTATDTAGATASLSFNIEVEASQFDFTLSSNQENWDLRSAALASGWDGTAELVVNISSGVYVWSDDTATAGLIVSGSFPGGLIVNNSGFIMGRGGNGAIYTTGFPGGPGVTVSLTSGSATFNNQPSGYIGGGGGGGAAANVYYGGGGGAGGGSAGIGYEKAGGAIGQVGQGYGGASFTFGEAGRGISSAGGGAGGGGGSRDDTGSDTTTQRGSAGGRIFPGAGGRGSTAGGWGGAGGSAGNAGVNGRDGDGNAGGGGGWGAAGGSAGGSAIRSIQNKH